MKISIIGAGVTGLTTAFEYIQNGHQVIIYESKNQVGGLASGIKEPHWDWTAEKYYHHWFASDDAMLSLIKDLNLSDKVIFSKPQTAVLFQDKFYPLDSIPAVFKFPGLNLVETLRFGVITAYLKYFANWRTLEKFTAHQWLEKYYGNSIYLSTWKPMLQGKFGPFYQDANMAWMWARLKARTPKLGTFEGGFQNFLDLFASQLTNLGVDIRLHTSVKKISSSNRQIIIHTSQSKEKFDQCLVTTSPKLFSSLTPQLPHTYTRSLNNLSSMGAVVVLYSLRKPLSPQKYYWYNLPKSSGFPFLALVEHTNFVSPTHFGGDHLVYCGDYRAADHSYFKLSSKKLVNKFTPTLKKINPKFDSSWINKTWTFRTPYAQPVPVVDHSQNIPHINTPIPNLYFASMSHIYPWDRGTNFAVDLGKKAAKIMQST